MLNNGVPEVALKNSVFVSNPLARHAIAFFATTEWIYVQQVSSAYRGSFHMLPFLSDINELGGTLSQYWFSIDQSIAANKDSPNHIADSVHLPNSAGSKSRASKELQVRSRRSTTTGGGFVKSNQTIGEASATGLMNRFTGSYQSKDQVKYEKVSCDSVLSRRGSKTKDQTQSDDEALVDNNNRNSENISSMSCDGRLSESGKSSVAYNADIDSSYNTTAALNPPICQQRTDGHSSTSTTCMNPVMINNISTAAVPLLQEANGNHLPFPGSTGTCACACASSSSASIDATAAAAAPIINLDQSDTTENDNHPGSSEFDMVLIFFFK
ncbi:unnamed protein product [Trichobilharzia szidati]|nr:unnamed protein product [Trichobilharzia szidati]